MYIRQFLESSCRWKSRRTGTRCGRPRQWRDDWWQRACAQHGNSGEAAWNASLEELEPCWPVWNLAVKCQHLLSCPRSVSNGDVAVSKKEIAWTRHVHVLGCVCRHKCAVSLLSNCSVCSTAGRNNTHGNCFHILMQYHILTKSYWCYKFILYLIF
jgi:hypothetical protein